MGPSLPPPVGLGAGLVGLAVAVGLALGFADGLAEGGALALGLADGGALALGLAEGDADALALGLADWVALGLEDGEGTVTEVLTFDTVRVISSPCCISSPSLGSVAITRPSPVSSSSTSTVTFTHVGDPHNLASASRAAVSVSPTNLGTVKVSPPLEITRLIAVPTITISGWQR